MKPSFLSEWTVVSNISAKLCKNKLQFDKEMMMKSTLYYTNTLSLIVFCTSSLEQQTVGKHPVFDLTPK